MSPLKILVLSSFYPPHFIGGYELGCADIVTQLQQRGHEVTVLTSTYGINAACYDGFVYRLLDVDVYPVPQASFAKQWHSFQRELHNQQIALNIARELQPDLIYVWSIHHASLSIVRLLQQAGYKTTFFISDLWPSRFLAWDTFYRLPRHPVRHISRRILGLYLRYKTGFREKMALNMDYAQFASRFLLESIQPHVPVNHAHIIHWGVDGSRFYVERTKRPLQPRLLYVGQIIEHKGIDTLLEAMSIVHHTYGLHDVTLSIVGGALSETYLATLQQQAIDLNVDHAIHWLGKLPRNDLPTIYAQYDVLLFPSRWEEPFSITVVEALAAGLVVIATATGGTPEIIEPEQTGLLFEHDDAEKCASHIKRVLEDAELAYTMRSNGQQRVQTMYQITAMCAKIEAALDEAVK